MLWKPANGVHSASLRVKTCWTAASLRKAAGAAGKVRKSSPVSSSRELMKRVTELMRNVSVNW